MRVAALARSKGIDLSVADILEHKKLSKLADVLSSSPKIENAVHFDAFSLVDAKTMDDLPAELKKLRSQNMIADIVSDLDFQVLFITQHSLSAFRLIIEGEIDVNRLRAVASPPYPNTAFCGLLLESSGIASSRSFLKRSMSPSSYPDGRGFGIRLPGILRSILQRATTIRKTSRRAQTDFPVRAGTCIYGSILTPQ